MKVGAPVWHRSRGQGTVTALRGVGAEAEIDVRFADGVTRTYKLDRGMASGAIAIGHAPAADAPKRKKPGLIIGAPTCRVCGCTEADCRQCIEKTGQACHWVEADLCSACVPPAASPPAAPPPAGPIKEPAMPTNRLEIQVAAPHPLFPRVLAACKLRKINRVIAIREMRISTGSWHALTHGAEIGPRLTAKIEAWLAPGAVRTAKSARPTVAKRQPQPVPQPVPVDLLRALVRQLNLPVVRAWIIKDDQLCERQAVVLS